jgi:hypothetical protein
MTNSKIFKSFEIAKHDAKLIVTRKIETHLDDFDNIIFNVNSDGSFFAYSGSADPHTIFVYCVESDQVFTHDCGSKVRFP